MRDFPTAKTARDTASGSDTDACPLSESHPECTPEPGAVPSQAIEVLALAPLRRTPGDAVNIDRDHEAQALDHYAEMVTCGTAECWEWISALPDEDFRDACIHQPILTYLLSGDAWRFDEWMTRAPSEVFFGVMEWYSGLDLTAFRDAPRELTIDRLDAVIDALRERYQEINATQAAHPEWSWAQVRDFVLSDCRLEN